MARRTRTATDEAPTNTTAPVPAITDPLGARAADDALVDIAVRLHAEFSDHVTLADILDVIDGCRRDLEAPSAAALPELVERLARQRLATVT